MQRGDDIPRMAPSRRLICTRLEVLFCRRAACVRDGRPTRESSPPTHAVSSAERNRHRPGQPRAPRSHRLPHAWPPHHARPGRRADDIDAHRVDGLLARGRGLHRSSDGASHPHDAHLSPHPLLPASGSLSALCSALFPLSSLRCPLPPDECAPPALAKLASLPPPSAPRDQALTYVSSGRSPVILPDSAELELSVPEDARHPARVSFDGNESTELFQGDSIYVSEKGTARSCGVVSRHGLRLEC